MMNNQAMPKGNNAGAHGTSSTRSGIQPSSSSLVWTIKTADVEEFLNKKIRALPGLTDISANVYTLGLTNLFRPFLVLFPLSVTKRDHDKHQSDNAVMNCMRNIDNHDDHDDSVRFTRPLYEMLKVYAFSDAIDNADKDKTIRAHLNLTRSTTQSMKTLRKPHFEVFNGGKYKFPAIALDPIMIFVDMLAEEGIDNSQYEINITGLKAMDAGNCEYTVTKRKKAKKPSAMAELDKFIIRKYNGHN